MPGKSVRRVRIIRQPSFPNNRLSTRFPRRKAVTRVTWKEEDPAYATVPPTALSTPWDLPNPTDDAPVLADA